jgi:hypothetical protein
VPRGTPFFLCVRAGILIPMQGLTILLLTMTMPPA